MAKNGLAARKENLVECCLVDADNIADAKEFVGERFVAETEAGLVVNVSGGKGVEAKVGHVLVKDASGGLAVTTQEKFAEQYVLLHTRSGSQD